MSTRGCSHLDAIDIESIKQPDRRECEECIKIGSYWGHLRACQTCGVTLCCDSSRNRHASKHAHASGHPVIASAEVGERWLSCYPDEAYVGYCTCRVPGVRRAAWLAVRILKESLMSDRGRHDAGRSGGVR